MNGSDLEDANSRSLRVPLLHDLWDFFHVLYVPQPNSPVLQRQTQWNCCRRLTEFQIQPSIFKNDMCPKNTFIFIRKWSNKLSGEHPLILTEGWIALNFTAMSCSHEASNVTLLYNYWHWRNHSLKMVLESKCRWTGDLSISPTWWCDPAASFLHCDR